MDLTTLQSASLMSAQESNHDKTPQIEKGVIHNGNIYNTKGMSKSAQDSKKLEYDFANFMKMLTVQLTHQDPTSPMETNEFTQQIVAFTGVEQAVATNKHLEKLIEVTQGTMLDKATGYLDKIIEIDMSEAELIQGKAIFNYKFPQDSNNVVISIYDENNKLVKHEMLKEQNGVRLELKAGVQQTYEWDGKDYKGEQLTDGKYKIEAQGISMIERPIAFDKDGKPTQYSKEPGEKVNAITSYTDIVKSIKEINGKVHLDTGKKIIPLSKVLSIHGNAVSNHLVDQKV